MSVGIKLELLVKNLQSPAEYPEGTEYVLPHLVYEFWLLKALFDMWMSCPLPKVGP